jgi:sugar phosphate isomerase/epimerase
MKLGVNFTPRHSSPQEWAEELLKMGVQATCFPVDYKAPVSTIDAYVAAARDYNIMIAEVGIWNSPLHPDKKLAQQALEVCEEQLRLAEYIKACCCVNVSGAAGPVWYGCYPENYSEAVYQRNIELVQYLCDKVKPKNTYFTLEVMQWMVPDSPKQYLKLIEEVNRQEFAVHMDVVNFINNPYLYTHFRELVDEAFSLLGSQTKSCHLKDCLMEEGTTVSIKEVSCGQGKMDLLYYLNKIDEVDPDMPVLLEHLNSRQEYEDALKYINGIYHC